MVEEIDEIIDIFTERDITYKLRFILSNSFPNYSNTFNIELTATAGPLSNRQDFLNEYVKDKINEEIKNYIIKKFIKNQDGLALIITNDDRCRTYPILFRYLYPRFETKLLNLRGSYSFKGNDGKIRSGDVPINVKKIIDAIFNNRPKNFSFFEAELNSGRSYFGDNKEIFIFRDDIKDLDIEDITNANIYINESNKPVIEILNREYKINSIEDSIIEEFGLEVDYAKEVIKKSDKLKVAAEKAQEVYEDFQDFSDEISDDLKLAAEIQYGRLR